MLFNLYQVVYAYTLTYLGAYTLTYAKQVYCDLGLIKG